MNKEFEFLKDKLEESEGKIKSQKIENETLKLQLKDIKE
jgi:hypothetical protein